MFLSLILGFVIVILLVWLFYWNLSDFEFVRVIYVYL